MTIAPSGIERWEEGDTQPQTKFNILATSHNLWVSGKVLSRTTDAQPGSPAEGDAYIITATPSGAAWAGFTENYVAQYLDGAWLEYAPIGAVRVYVADEAVDVRWNGSAWAAATASNEFADNVFRIQDNGDATKELAFEVSAITTGTTRTITMPDANVDLTFVASEPFTSDVATVADQDYVLWYDAPFPGTITMIRTESASGTCTLTGKVNTTALGGTANAVSSTAQEQAHSSSNTFVKGDKVQYTVSANAACLTMAVTFYITRTG